MPTYEYRCRDCGRDFELFQRMSDPPVAACPSCGEASERLISGGAGFLFKGEGFYITDYRSEDYRKKARAEKGEAGGKSDSKSGNGGGKGDGKRGAGSVSASESKASGAGGGTSKGKGASADGGGGPG